MKSTGGFLIQQNPEESPLAEGRELKYADAVADVLPRESPLAEGRELKCVAERLRMPGNNVAPRGGA